MNGNHPNRQRSGISSGLVQLLVTAGVIAWDVSKGQTTEERQAIVRDWLKSALITIPLTLIGIVIFSLLVYEVLGI